MTDQPPTPGPRRREEATVPTDELGRIPDWLRAPAVDVEPVGADRRRIWRARHSGRLLGGVAALLVLSFFGAVGIVTYRAFQRWGDGTPAAYPTVSQPPGERASTSASPPPATVTGPFDGTPAAAFPEGAAGIALPAAKRTGPFTGKQVAAGLAKVRTALLTGRLDRSFMTAKSPDRFLRLFAPDARAGLRDDFASGTAVSYATRLAPGARITGHQPRVKGRVSYRSVRDRDGIRVLEVTTNFVWVYAFRSPTADPVDGVVLVHDTVVWQIPHPADVRASSNGLWIDTADSYGSNIECATFDKGLVDVAAPSFGGPAATEDPDAMFDPERSLDIEDSC